MLFVVPSSQKVDAAIKCIASRLSSPSYRTVISSITIGNDVIGLLSCFNCLNAEHSALRCL